MPIKIGLAFINVVIKDVRNAVELAKILKKQCILWIMTKERLRM